MRALISMLILTVLTATARADLDSLRSEAQIAAAAGEVEVATSKLRQILDLAPSNGTFGKSFNYYDPGRDHWRQIWIGDSGSFIEFTGEARDGGIFFTAETNNPADGGETWQSIWDGRYERKTP
jgi:hypothetical protein